MIASWESDTNPQSRRIIPQCDGCIVQPANCLDQRQAEPVPTGGPAFFNTVKATEHLFSLLIRDPLAVIRNAQQRAIHAILQHDLK